MYFASAWRYVIKEWMRDCERTSDKKFENYRVTYLDLPGFGGSSNTIRFVAPMPGYLGFGGPQVQESRQGLVGEHVE